MGFRRVSLVQAVCDGCGPNWWTSTADDSPRFESQAEARRLLAEVWGWRIERPDLSGRVRMFCPPCAVRSECERYGHDWPTVPDGRLQCCHRCNKVNRDDAPPADHPDAAVTSGLPPWLADVEAELFGEGPGGAH